MSLSGIKWEAYEIAARPADELGNAAAAQVRLIVWCKTRVEPDPTEMAARYGADTRFSIGGSGLSVPDTVAGKWIWSSPVPAIPDGSRHREADRVPFPKSIRPIDKSYGPTGLSLLAR